MQPTRHTSPRRRSIAVATIVSLVALVACSDDSDSLPTSTPVATSTTTAASSTTATVDSTTTTVPAASGRAGAPRLLSAFAPYNDIPLLDGSTPYAGPATPTSLDDVQILDLLSEQLASEPELAAALEAQGFVIWSGYPSRFFHQLYESGAYNFETLFVTTDSMYHSWHNAFSKVLRDTETDVLVPALSDYLTRSVVAA
ncbi:MAG: DUF3160 domain-containing protein, partial [Actinobacteria bacterium]|nr:DUF3160 domain-containing protein [Actinomycetota bacterium]